MLEYDYGPNVDFTVVKSSTKQTKVDHGSSKLK